MSRSIRDLAPKPSDAIQAMIDGLLENSTRTDFRIDMTTYGNIDSEEKICFGCAATCTIQKLSGVQLTPDIYIEYTDDRAMAVNVNSTELIKFEIAINSFRSGYPEDLLELYEVYNIENRELMRWKIKWTGEWFLSSDDWKQQLHRVDHALEELKKLGY